jgi:two-component system response regulator AgrA
MLNFIVCDDKKKIVDDVTKTINKVMIGNKYAYKIHKFYEYDNEFMKIVNSKMAAKIYILDIETPKKSGIDVARKIRTKDINSTIIFLTSHQELGEVLLQEEVMFLSFINKFNNSKTRLKKAIQKSIQFAGKRNAIRFQCHGAVFTIPTSDILYITRDSVERKCIIKTDYTEFKLIKPLSEMIELLGPDFAYSHRACIVNLKRIHLIDKHHRIIVFDNGNKLDLVSSKYVKEMISSK